MPSVRPSERVRTHSIPHVCLGCADAFTPTRWWQTCCSTPCRARAHRARRRARLLAALNALADYLPGRAQDAYDAMVKEIQGGPPA